MATGDVSEDTEGLMIVVEATVTRGPVNDLPFGYSVFVDDGTGRDPDLHPRLDLPQLVGRLHS